MNIALIGMPGSGKITVALLLAKKLVGFSFVDTDAKIVEIQKTSINDIFAKKGEQFFRKLETQVLTSILKKDKQIISTGGGIILSDINKKLLKENSFLIYLKTSEKTLYERIKNNKERPLLNTSDLSNRLHQLILQRKSLYEDAQFIIETDDKTPDIIVDEILRLING